MLHTTMASSHASALPWSRSPGYRAGRRGFTIRFKPVRQHWRAAASGGAFAREPFKSRVVAERLISHGLPHSLAPVPKRWGFPSAQARTGKTDMKVPYRIYCDPLPKRRNGRSSKYPISEMRVGDCFYVPVGELKSRASIEAMTRAWARRNSKAWKFVVSECDDQFGVWRVE